MNGAIKNKTLKPLSDRFPRHIEGRKASDKKDQNFIDHLLKVDGKKDSKESKRYRSAPQMARAANTSRGVGKAKAITDTQALRIARLAPFIERAAIKHGVPVELICGVILQESGGNHKALSHCGAMGLMQLMPGTAKRFGVTNAFDPIQNIEGGTKYLRYLLDRFKGRLDLTLAGYNAGEGNVAKYGNKVPPFAETRGYVPNVLGYTQTMINIFHASANRVDLPANARRV